MRGNLAHLIAYHFGFQLDKRGRIVFDSSLPEAFGMQI